MAFGKLGARGGFGSFGVLGRTGTSPGVTGFNFVAVDGAQNPINAIIESPGAVEWNGKIYVAYQGAQYDLYIVRIDKATQRIDQGPWFVSTNTLTNDAHGTPAIWIESDGTIHFFGGCHITALQYARSSAGGDITTFVKQTSPLASCSYPSIHQTSDGKLWLFYRTAGHLSPWGYITSTDHGVTWSAATNFLLYGQALNDTAYPYITKDPLSDAFHISWVWQDENNSISNPFNASTIVNRYNVYYYKLTAAGVKTNIAGTALGTWPPTLASSNSECLVLNTQVSFKYANVPVVAVDANGVPFLLSNIVSDGTTAIPHNYTALWWNGSSVSSSIITTTDYTLDEYNWEVVSGTLAGSNVVLRAYVTTGGSPGTHGDFDTNQLDRGGNIEEWTSAAGVASWSKTATLATAADTTHLFNTPVLVRGYTSTPKLFYTDWQNSLTGPFNAHVYPYPATSIVTPMLSQTKALLSRIAASLTTEQQFELDTIWRNFVSIGVDLKWDAFYLAGGFDDQSSRLNWMSTNFTLANVGAGPTFAAGGGYTGNGTSTALDTTIVPGLLSNMTQNSAEHGVWVNTDAAVGVADCGVAFATGDYITTRDASNQLGGRINATATSVQTSITDGRRLSSIRRTGATAGLFLKNGAPGTTFSTTSAAPDSTAGHTIWLCGANLGTPQFSAKQVGAYYMGAALTNAQSLAVYQILYSWFRRRLKI